MAIRRSRRSTHFVRPLINASRHFVYGADLMMYANNILNCLEKRRLGYNVEIKKNIYDIFIERLSFMSQKNSLSNTLLNTDVGNTFACKFSRNKNNLHVIGCSSEHGEIIIQNTSSCYDFLNEKYERNIIHGNAIFNFAWAEPDMKLITACGDHSSKLCSLHPSGKLVEERQFLYTSSVRSVMFCPGSSDVFCGGCQDGSIKIWDSRMHNKSSVVNFDCNIPNAHGVYKGSHMKNKKSRIFGISTVIYRNDQNILSCSLMDTDIKLWDLRKSYRQVKAFTEPLPLKKYYHDKEMAKLNTGYGDMIINPQSTHLYASGSNHVIYCYSLDSTERKPICQYSGHLHETGYSKISISNDGCYLFSGCIEQTGVIYSTGLPHIEKPVLVMLNKLSGSGKELSTSDWCADSSSLKLAASSDSMPMIWSILSNEEKKFSNNIEFSKTEAYKSKSFSKKLYTTPIVFDSELKEKLQKETEKNMENWDLQSNNLVSIIDSSIVTPKKPWDDIFTKVTSPSSSQVSPQSELKSALSSPSTSKQIPEAVTPTSRKKRKKSVVSPRSLIDHYLIPSKREKLDTVLEM